MKKRRWLILGGSVGLGLVAFLLLWFFYSLLAGVVCGVAIWGVSLVYTLNAFAQSNSAFDAYKSQCKDERIEFHDTAGLMIEKQELVGTLVVTDRHLAFVSTMVAGGFVLEMEFTDIAKVCNVRGILHVTTHDTLHRFKVFRCNKMVAMLQRKSNSMGQSSCGN